MIARLALLLLLFPAVASSAAREYSIDLWDWTTSCRDIEQFKQWAADMKSIGVTRVEISAPWNLLEPSPGKYDLSFIADRLAVVKSHGMGLRVRLNSFYNGATPAWYEGDRWLDIDGKPPVGTPWPVSICDERFWSHFGPLCTKLAETFKGEDVIFNAFIGIHAELKWSDWWSYDASTLAHWREVMRERPAWLIDVAGDAPLPDKPPIPPLTHGTPDNSPASKAWIAFRQQVWRDAMTRFGDSLRAGDADVKMSAPLGESFRRDSARMSNLDYAGLSRGVDQVVHSYDFFWHVKDEPWQAAAAVSSFQGITGIKNVAFEFDSPPALTQLGYSDDQLVGIARAVLARGAGLKVANFSGSDALPSTNAFLRKLGELASQASPPPMEQPEITTLLFLSNWANYCYREPTEWLHEAQFGAWHMLTSNGLPVRIICEDNMSEDLSGYRSLYVAFSPPELLPRSAKGKLESLYHEIPSVVELSESPPKPPNASSGTLGYRWLCGNREACKSELDPVLRILTRSDR